MARERAIQIRVFQHEYDAIDAKAKDAGLGISEYMRTCALEGSISRLLESKAAPPSAGADLSKPENRAKATEQAEHFIQTDSRETAEASLQPLITQLRGQGMTTPVATREARKRLGL